MNIRDNKVKAEQHRVRSFLQDASITGSTEIERAMAMYMEADTFLKENGIGVTAGNADGMFN